ncbi:hypothetical protein U1Q18_038157 [Sarracenia purpurea var. burkii]
MIRPVGGIDIPHPEHGVDEVGAEGALATIVFIDNRVGGSAIEDLLIGVEESPPVLKILVAVVVKNDRNASELVMPGQLLYLV